jgi:hypothetical protein
MDDCLSDASNVELSRAEVAMLIDALLQARATLCAADDHFVSTPLIEWMRAQQLLLADRLEDVMSQPVASLIASTGLTLHMPSS